MACKKDEIELDGEIYVRKSSLKTEAKDLDGMRCVLVRSYSAGIHFGYLKSTEHTLAGTLVTLADTQRVYSWQGAATLSQMALEGVKKPEGCKFSVILPENTVQNCIEIIPISQQAWECLRGVTVWKI